MEDQVAIPAPQEPVEAVEPQAAEQVEQVEAAPVELTDEDYRLNFLGSDKFELPKETPEEIRQALKALEKNINKGWTDKNMRLSQEAKEQQARIQAERLALQQQAELQQSSIKELAKIEALQDRLGEYDKLSIMDWQRWAQENPEAAQRGVVERQALQSEVAKLREGVEQRHREATAKQAQFVQDFLSKAQQRLSTKIADWSEGKQATLSKFVAESYLDTGTPADQNAWQAINWHPGLVEMAHDAMAYRESLRKAAPVQAKVTPQPVIKVGGAAPATKDPNKMTDAEWFEWRNKDLAEKRRTMNRR